jgi:hypothetical protein
LQFWQAFPKHNLGLLLKVASDSGKAEASPHDLGLIGKTEAKPEAVVMKYLSKSHKF